jgi:hypothetical protein
MTVRSLSPLVLHLQVRSQQYDTVLVLVVSLLSTQHSVQALLY